MTFKEYLAGAKVAYDAVGDFVRLARADPGMPDARSLEELTAYLHSRGDYQAMDVARQVWSSYQRSMKERTRAASRS